jgi:hypothetical protein
VDLQDKTVIVELKPGVVLVPERFRRAIRKAGYETRDFRLTLQARVERTVSGYRLRLPDNKQWFAVRAGGAAEQLASQNGELIRAVGVLVSDGPPVELELSSVEPVKK